MCNNILKSYLDFFHTCNKGISRPGTQRAMPWVSVKEKRVVFELLRTRNLTSKRDF